MWNGGPVCPVCGEELTVALGVGSGSGRRGRGGGLRRMGRRGRWRGLQVGDAAADTWDEVLFESPSRAPTVQADVWVPLGQAAVSGVIAALGAMVLRARWGWEFWTVPGAAVALGAVTWWWRLTDLAKLLRDVERFVSRDQVEEERGEAPEFSVKGATAKPQVGREGLGWNLSATRQQKGVSMDIAPPGDLATLAEWREVARRVLVEREKFSRSVMTRELFSQSRFHKVKEWMLEECLMIPNPDGSNGFRVTGRGREFFGALRL